MPVFVLTAYLSNPLETQHWELPATSYEELDRAADTKLRLVYGARLTRYSIYQKGPPARPAPPRPLPVAPPKVKPPPPNPEAGLVPLRDFVRRLATIRCYRELYRRGQLEKITSKTLECQICHGGGVGKPQELLMLAAGQYLCIDCFKETYFGRGESLGTAGHGHPTTPCSDQRYHGSRWFDGEW